MEDWTSDERREMADWIAEHGTPALKARLAAGDDLEWHYLEARRQREWPGWTRIVSPRQRLVFDGVPSLDAMEQELGYEGAETMRLIVDRTDDAGRAYEDDHGEVLVMHGWLGRWTLYKYVDYGP